MKKFFKKDDFDTLQMGLEEADWKQYAKINKNKKKFEQEQLTKLEKKQGIKPTKKTTTKTKTKAAKPAAVKKTKVKQKPKEVKIITDAKGNTPIASFQDVHLGFTSKTSSAYKEVIRGVSLDIYPGEIVGILGESGSGKTVLTTGLLGLLPEEAVIKSGKIKLAGIDVTEFTLKEWSKSGLWGTVITSVFQNPMKTLNPVRTVQDQFLETLIINNRIENKKEGIKLAKEYLEIVQIKNIDNVMKAYPHELSGGMIQRVVIAMALSTEAQIIVMDEPTTALDPVVQAEIVNLVIDIKDKFDTAFIFITHDIGVIGAVADKIAVMYAGKIVEYGKNEEIIWNPKHPYTWNLLMAMPDLNQGDELFTIPGAVPADSTGAKHEVYSARNNYALDIDFQEESPRYDISKTHFVYSRLYDKKAPKFDAPKLIQNRWEEFKKRKAGK